MKCSSDPNLFKCSSDPNLLLLAGAVISDDCRYALELHIRQVVDISCSATIRIADFSSTQKER
ncbi:MAG: hypothetical protein V3T17_19900 [Pseudomonadales bacterium]